MSRGIAVPIREFPLRNPGIVVPTQDIPWLPRNRSNSRTLVWVSRNRCSKSGMPFEYQGIVFRIRQIFVWVPRSRLEIVVPNQEWRLRTKASFFDFGNLSSGYRGIAVPFWEFSFANRFSNSGVFVESRASFIQMPSKETKGTLPARVVM